MLNFWTTRNCSIFVRFVSSLLVWFLHVVVVYTCKPIYPIRCLHDYRFQALQKWNSISVSQKNPSLLFEILTMNINVLCLSLVMFRHVWRFFCSGNLLVRQHFQHSADFVLLTVSYSDFLSYSFGVRQVIVSPVYLGIQLRHCRNNTEFTCNLREAPEGKMPPTSLFVKKNRAAWNIVILEPIPLGIPTVLPPPPNSV